MKTDVSSVLFVFLVHILCFICCKQSVHWTIHYDTITRNVMLVWLS